MDIGFEGGLLLLYTKLSHMRGRSGSGSGGVALLISLHYDTARRLFRLVSWTVYKRQIIDKDSRAKVVEREGEGERDDFMSTVVDTFSKAL